MVGAKVVQMQRRCAVVQSRRVLLAQISSTRLQSKDVEIDGFKPAHIVGAAQGLEPQSVLDGALGFSEEGMAGKYRDLERSTTPDKRGG
jgi:hypothetical protein